MLIKSLHSEALLFSTIYGEIHSQSFFISSQHVLKSSCVSFLLAVFGIEWKIEMMSLRILFLAVKFKNILKFTLWHISYLEAFFKHHLFLICLFHSLSIFFSFDSLVSL